MIKRLAHFIYPLYKELRLLHHQERKDFKRKYLDHLPEPFRSDSLEDYKHEV